MSSYEGFLNPRFYDFDSITEAIKDFGSVGEIGFDNGKVRVLTKDDYLTSEELFYEFSNYVLGLMKNNTIV